MRHVFAIAVSLSMTTAAVAENCQLLGHQIICDNGVSGQRIGNNTYWSDGSSSRQIGPFTYNSDGSSSQQIGNHTYYSDGESSHTIGNTTYFSDGRTCRRIGNNIYCDQSAEWRARRRMPPPTMGGDGAGEGNRTLVFSLEVAKFLNAFNRHSDILQPQRRLRLLRNFSLSEWPLTGAASGKRLREIAAELAFLNIHLKEGSPRSTWRRSFTASKENPSGRTRYARLRRPGKLMHYLFQRNLPMMKSHKFSDAELEARMLADRLTFLFDENGKFIEDSTAPAQPAGPQAHAP